VPLGLRFCLRELDKLFDARIRVLDLFFVQP
jgi:hypothetical protein